jgi:hypothetical protein
MAEREGFEPPIALRLCLISSQVHSTGLCHLSACVLGAFVVKALRAREVRDPNTIPLQRIQVYRQIQIGCNVPADARTPLTPSGNAGMGYGLNGYAPAGQRAGVSRKMREAWESRVRSIPWPLEGRSVWVMRSVSLGGFWAKCVLRSASTSRQSNRIGAGSGPRLKKARIAEPSG